MSVKLAILAGVVSALSCASHSVAQDVLTYHNDVARTGLNPHESILTLGNVNSTTFGKLFTIAVDGKVDAQPLYASVVNISGQGSHNVLYVATEHDSVYAFDADSGALLWQSSMLGSGETTSDSRSCSQVTPEIGVTATPLIDRTSGPNGTVYVIAMSKDASGTYHQRMHALDITTGQEEFGGPTEIAATYPGTGADSNGTQDRFNPGQYKERPGLLLVNHLIYTAWSSHCDDAPYTGWVMAYDESSLHQVSALDLTPNGSDGAIWMSGDGLAADSSGSIYLLMGNGTFDTSLNSSGFPSESDYGNAFVRLSNTSNTLAVADYFTMHNTGSESSVDQDLGSGGELLLPDMLDANGVTRHLAVGAGKDKTIYMVDRDNMGKFSSASDNIYQELPSALPGGAWSVPAYFNGLLYYGDVGDNLLAFQFSNARLQATPVSRTSASFAYPGTTPSISANGTSNGIVWATANTSPAILYAYDASNLSHELYDSNQASGGRDQFGAGNKFVTPTIANGKVYVATTTGIGVFGLLNAPVNPPNFSLTPGTYNTPQTVSLSDSTAGTAIYYTVDGSTPTTSSTAYSSPIAVNTTTTINAIAVLGGTTSSVATGTYTLQVATPTFGPAGGSYSSAQSVMLSDSTPGATIYYTLDGSTPTTSSLVYTGSIAVNSSATIKAMGVAGGYLSSAVNTSTYLIGSASLSLGLVGWWTFNDGSGTTAADSSGNSYNATLVNGVSWVAGELGGAISANGVNQSVSIPAINLSGTSTVTIALWFNHTYSTVGGHTLFEDSSNFNSSTTGFGLFPDDDDCNGIMAGVHGNEGYSINCYKHPSSGAWHHLAVIYDKTQPGNSEVTLYIDGVLQSPTMNDYTVTNTNAFGNNPIFLFARGGASEYTSGEVDDLRLYNRALSASEIQQLYQANGPSVVSIAVAPANPAIAAGATQQFTATGTFSDGSTANLTSSVTWSSTNTAIATVASDGLATGVAAGSATIQAASGSISGSSSLTVTAPVLVSIAVTPVNTSLTAGSTQQFTATGTYSNGSTANVTSSVTWSSTNTSVATIAGSGLATAASVGSTTIKATSGSVSGSSSLTVTAPVLVSIAVTPANTSLTTGSTQQFTATGTYSNGSTANMTSSVTWSSTSTSVATITGGGLATAASVGSTTIQAASGSISGSTGLTVIAASIPGMLGWWKFDDGSGTTAADSSGNGYIATLVNGVSWVTGDTGDAVSANGVNQYITIPAINLSSTNAITWMAWVNRTYSTVKQSVLFENSSNFNQSTTGFGFFPDDAADCSTSAPLMTGVQGNVGYTLNCYAQPSSGVWHHIAVVYDKSQPASHVISFYVDGVLQTPAIYLYTATNTNSFGNNVFYVFSRAGSQQFSAGEIDDLRVYNSALTAAQVQQIYQSGESQ